jgi:hypothetical protein
MIVTNNLRVALLPILLILAAPVLGKDLLIVNVEAIKQTALNAVLDAHPEVFEDDLLVDPHENNITLVCMPDRFLQEAKAVDRHVRQCRVQFRFMLRDSLELQQFMDDQGNCYELRSVTGFSVSVFADGTSDMGEISGPDGRITWIDCDELLNTTADKTQARVRRPVPLEVVPGMAGTPPGPGLFYVDVGAIREAAAEAADAAYPEYSGGGLLPEDPDRPLVVNCHSIIEQAGESAVPGMYLCFAHVEFTIADSVETSHFLADDGTCSLASRQVSMKVAIGDDGGVVVDKPRFGCPTRSGDGIECEPGPGTLSESEAFDAWCQPGEKQAL